MYWHLPSVNLGENPQDSPHHYAKEPGIWTPMGCQYNKTGGSKTEVHAKNSFAITTITIVT